MSHRAFLCLVLTVTNSQCLPCFQTNAIVAHPEEVSSIAVSCDGYFVFSAGGSDLSVNMWAVLRDDSTPSHSNALEPFLSLLEGGPGGELHESLLDYFYYSQLRHGGEDTMEARHLSGHVPLEEIPALVRSVGYYPSEEEVINIINEVRYKQFVVTGEMQDFIGVVSRENSANVMERAGFLSFSLSRFFSCGQETSNGELCADLCMCRVLRRRSLFGCTSIIAPWFLSRSISFKRRLKPLPIDWEQEAASPFPGRD